MNKICFLFFVSIILGMVSCSEKEPESDPVYTVTFDADGGTPTPSAQSVKAREMATAPAPNPIKTGYVFLFWHLAGVETAYNFQTPVTGKITLVARWQEQSVAEYWQVAWELNGGTWPAGDNHATQVIKGGTLTEPAAPVKSGYTFEGWYKEAAFTNKIAFPYDVSNVTGNMTLYAKWTTGGGNPSANNHNISSAADWNAAIAAVNAAGNNKTHTFNIIQSFELQGTNSTTFTKTLTGLTVTIKGQGVPAPQISLAGNSTGYLIYLDPDEPQKMILETIVLKGHATNNKPVIDIGIDAEVVMGEGTCVTGNTNTSGRGGGVYIIGLLTMKGGEISGNTAGTSADKNGKGGGVYMIDMSDFVMEGGSISGNTSHGQGGGVYVDFEANFSMKDGIIYGNTARVPSSGARGGGVYNYYGNFRMSGGKITGYDWTHVDGNAINGVEHNPIDLSKRDACNVVLITGTAVGNFGAALYSNGGDNYYGSFAGENFTQTGDFGSNIHIERDIEMADGVRLNRFEANGETYLPYRGGMDYWGHFFNAATENVFLGLTTIYGEWITLDMLVPSGNNKIVAGTYTFSAAADHTATAYTFVDNNYTSYLQDADGKKLKMTAGTVKVSVAGTGDNAVYTIVVDCTLENAGKVKGTYRGALKWYDRTGG